MLAEVGGTEVAELSGPDEPAGSDELQAEQATAATGRAADTMSPRHRQRLITSPRSADEGLATPNSRGPGRRGRRDASLAPAGATGR